MEILEKFRKYREYYNPSINNNHKNWLITLKYLQQDLKGLARYARTEVCFQHSTNYGPLWCINYQWFNKTLWQCLGDTVNPENNLDIGGDRTENVYG